MFFKRFLGNKRIYLDYASSTPFDKDLFKGLSHIPKSILSANPGALHYEAVQLKKVLEGDRAKIAKAIFAHSDEIIFTSGATESNNLAISGAIKSFLKEGIKHEEILIITTDREHSSIAEQINYWKKLGTKHSEISVVDGKWNFKDIEIANNIKVVIFSIIYINNETGLVSPIKEIAKHIRVLKKESSQGRSLVFHIDATQAPLHYELRVDRLGVDLMTIGATKLYTHKGVGMLYKKRNVNLEPIILGGGQEQGLRAGTESVELIHHFAHAFVKYQENFEKYSEKIKSLQEYFEKKITSISGISITNKDLERSPHITHVNVKGVDSELLVIEMDARGVALSSKSACKNDLPAPDIHGGQAGNENIDYNSDLGELRFSFGKWTTKRDLDKAISKLIEILKKYNK